MNKIQWIKKCQHWKNIWPVIQNSYLTNDENGLNLYAVLDAVNKYSSPNHVLMGDAGSISYAGPVALNPKKKQRMIFSPAQADMGWALPASIGVAIASKQPVISIIGDGSFMTNLQELAVVKQHNLNISFVILNNKGYLSIKNTQQKYFEGRVYGTSGETGLWFPNFSQVAETFEMGYYPVNDINDLNKLTAIFNDTNPKIIDCRCTPEQEILPSQSLKNGKQAGLHDMFPFLADEELKKEMCVKLE